MVDLQILGGQATGYGFDSLISIENLLSGSGNDSLRGDAFDNALTSGKGDDTLVGSEGNDRLYGGDGNDLLGAGLDNDLIDGGDGTDTATFDAFRLDQSIFTDIALGVMAAAAFRANTAGMARDASDRIIYDTDSGFLFYDADGSGAASRVLLTTLDVGLSLTALNFTVEA